MSLGFFYARKVKKVCGLQPLEATKLKAQSLRSAVFWRTESSKGKASVSERFVGDINSFNFA
jgi:hypothetical protein